MIEVSENLRNFFFFENTPDFETLSLIFFRLNIFSHFFSKLGKNKSEVHMTNFQQDQRTFKKVPDTHE